MSQSENIAQLHLVEKMNSKIVNFVFGPLIASIPFASFILGKEACASPGDNTKALKRDGTKFLKN